jgi:hypothetical protein
MSTTFVLSVLGQTIGTIGLVHAKVKISSVLVHYATHGKGLKQPMLSRALAEAMSIFVLSTPFKEYKRVHDGHHRNSSFASMADEEARYLFDLGFRPGTPQADLWRTFWQTLWSPSFHAKAISVRLRQNFVREPLARAFAAWAFWLAVLSGTAYAGWLPALLLGVLVPIFIGGNIGSFLELVSRHRWLVTPEKGVRRQFALSHGRFLAPIPPARGAGARVWMRWMMDVIASAMGRLMVVPGDLNWHIAHHIGLAPAVRHAQPPWTDAASAYSAQYWSDEHLRTQSHESILQAVGSWFGALEAEPREAADR